MDQKRKFPADWIIHEMVVNWFCKVLNDYIHISGSFLKEKKSQLNEFNQRIEEFCQKHNIMCGESAHATAENIKGLFFHILPTKTFALGNDFFKKCFRIVKHLLQLLKILVRQADKRRWIYIFLSKYTVAFF